MAFSIPPEKQLPLSIAFFVLSLVIIIGAVFIGSGKINFSGFAAPTPTPTPTLEPTSTPVPSITPEDEVPTKKPVPKVTAKPALSPTPSAVPTPAASPTPTGTIVTNVKVSIDNNNVTSSCPHTFTFSGNITTNGSGTVKYYWEKSDGTKGGEKSLSFDSSGEKTVENDTWPLGEPGKSYTDKWERIVVTSPNAKTSDNATFTLTCSS